MSHLDRVCKFPQRGDVRMVTINRLGTYLLQVTDVTDTQIHCSFHNIMNTPILLDFEMSFSPARWEKNMQKYGTFVQSSK